MKNYLWILFLLVGAFISKGQNLSIQEINKNMGRGMNMGNMFEAPTETEWGNPFRDDYFERIASQGFKHVRIPVRWDVPARAQQTAPYTINASFLARIKTVVDNALANKLMVVFNMHHHEEIFSNPANAKERFLSQWGQIAAYFKDYNQNLLFEILNEPHDKLTPELWNIYLKDALAEIRKTNPTRGVVIGPGNYNAVGSMRQLEIPNDKNLIVSIHYYNPFQFTHQGADWIGGDSKSWLGTKWEDYELEREQVKNEFSYLLKLAKEKNLAVHIGEFGAYSTADIASRGKWTTFLARWFEEQNFSWAYWEWSAGFGIFDKSNNQYNAVLRDALTKNVLSAPKKLNTKDIYVSNFASDNDGWSLNVSAGNAIASLTNSSNIAIVDITKASASSWHVQLNKGTFAIAKGKKYQMLIKASASLPTSLTGYVGNSVGDHKSYSGYLGIDLEPEIKTFATTFTASETDLAAKITFDMAKAVSKINIESVSLKEVLPDNISTETVLGIEDNDQDVGINIYPNPSPSEIIISGIDNISEVNIQNSKGSKMPLASSLNQNKLKINIGFYPTGVYFIELKTAKGKLVRKFIKQ